MTLAAGTKLGPYEILAPLGAGGMGEVYRARDERLKRDVAVKVLPGSLSSDPERLKRFEHEAQAAGGLNHPNITAVYDVGQHDGAPYVVQELLEGETLRAALMRGPLPSRKAIEYASQIARGLAAAHEKGVVHRDLKPENLFLTRDGRAKILDFGLAKLVQPEQDSGPASALPTQSEATEPGVVLGTLGYMSPEQVRGRPADARSDIFAFGCVLYEMLSGQRAFRGDTAADTMSAILTKEPPDLSDANESVSPILNKVVRHCMEKSPDERFQSARDLAFALESSSAASGKAAPIEAPRRLPRTGLLLAAAVVCLLATALLFRPGARYEPPSFKQLTFRRGNLLERSLHAGRCVDHLQCGLGNRQRGSLHRSARWDGVASVRPEECERHRRVVEGRGCGSAFEDESPGGGHLRDPGSRAIGGRNAEGVARRRLQRGLEPGWDEAGG